MPARVISFKQIEAAQAEFDARTEWRVEQQTTDQRDASAVTQRHLLVLHPPKPPAESDEVASTNVMDPAADSRTPAKPFKRQPREELLGEVTVSASNAVFYRLLNPGGIRISFSTVETAKVALLSVALRRFTAEQISAQKAAQRISTRCGTL